MGNEEDNSEGEPLLRDRAVRLFKFLAAVQQLKTKTPRHLEAYERDGEVIWFHRLPAHEAITSSHRVGSPSPEDPILEIDRVPRLSPPQPPALVAPWLASDADDPARRPELQSERIVERKDAEPETDESGGEIRLETIHLDSYPEVVGAYNEWIVHWELWAQSEAVLRPVRDVYGKLFSIHLAVTGNPEQLEVMCAVNCLAWDPVGSEPTLRHSFTTPATIEFDDDSGRLTVRPRDITAGLTLEWDMLDPGVITDPRRITEIQKDAADSVGHPFDREIASILGRRFVHCLDPGGQYDEDDECPDIGANPRATFAPALILRKRSQLGLLQVFQQVISQLETISTVPEGLVPLIDPNFVPELTPGWGDESGAMVQVDDDLFLPLPVNEAQMRVVRQVDRSAQVLVQGPPGTGKTHTAAALISHLLAQGKRVLVTAQTDRALKEVRSKLPEAIKPLSVAVVGTGREDMADLKMAVNEIANTAAEHDDEESQRDIDRLLEQIDELRQHRAQAHHALVEARELETRAFERGSYSGTLAQIALKHQDLSKRYQWIESLVSIEPDIDPPLTNLEMAEFRSYQADAEIRSLEDQAYRSLPERSEVPTPESVADFVRQYWSASDAYEAYADVVRRPDYQPLSRLPTSELSDLLLTVRRVNEQVVALERRPDPWMKLAIADVLQMKSTPWHARRNEIASLVGQLGAVVVQLDPVLQIQCVGDPAQFRPVALALLQFLQGGGKIRTSSGQPRVGRFANQALRNADHFFDSVRVGGIPATTWESVAAFLRWTDAQTLLAVLDKAWPHGMEPPTEGSIPLRLAQQQAALEQLDEVLALAQDLQSVNTRLENSNARPVVWSDLEDVILMSRMIGAELVHRTKAQIEASLDDMRAGLAPFARNANPAACCVALLQAIETRDHEQYRDAYQALLQLLEVRSRIARRDLLASKLDHIALPLLVHLTEHPSDTQLTEQLREFVEAWNWKSTGTWIREHRSADVNGLRTAMNSIENEIRGLVSELAACRAWRHAVSPERITGQARADLELYVTLVRQLGKGTGIYAAQRRADIRKAMDQCRPSVPVWIMPIYRIAEQLRIAPNIFDVVVVDEASQAGVEATFLQYLAPRIVVIGDDKQVSPAGVGVNQQDLRDLANQFLYDDRYKAAWQGPETSLFDQAKMRYAGLITLVEHRRCVPEIIGFSNQIAYEPDGIRLVPVRQYGADRLEPIKPVYVESGYTKGTQTRTNPVEAEAIVDCIEKCITDPRYDGMTMGVVSLLGKAQAQLIERILLERVAPEEWSARDLRCGDSADFQGSERNVVFLSMVVAPEPGRRIMPLVRELFLQRFNVAASRAQDQMWVFHSVGLAELTNSEDLRRQLLEYCYGVVNRSMTVTTQFQNPVPEDVRVSPFDSLFEQRVFNRIIDRGFTVIPQFEVQGYRIDLVIVGAGTKVAIECDGDYWHGPERYEADLARMRDLERCDWNFFNIRESQFYVDRSGSLAPLWEMLETLGVRPSNWTPPEVPESSDQEHTASTPPADLDGDSEHALTQDEVEIPLASEPPTSGPFESVSRPHQFSVIPYPDGASEYDLENQTYRCEGTCGRELPIRKFPTTTPTERTGECRECRNIRVGRTRQAALPSTDGRNPSPTTDAAVETEAFSRPEDLPAQRRDAPVRLKEGSPQLPVGTEAQSRVASVGVGSGRAPVVPKRSSLLASYKVFHGQCTPTEAAPASVLISEILAIVEVEGPLTGARLQQAHVHAAGGRRVGRQIAHKLNSAVTAALRKKWLVADNPLSEQGVKPLTLRLESQPIYIVRELGPRDLSEVPPLEVAALMHSLAGSHGFADHETLFRSVLEAYGRRRLTPNVDSLLSRLVPLAQDMAED